MYKIISTVALSLSLSTAVHAGSGRTVIDPQVSGMQSIGILRGDTPEGAWVGGMVAIAQTACHIAATTAGHNIKDGLGKPTAPLEKISLIFAGFELPVVHALTDPFEISTTPPEHDWAVVIAKKPTCGMNFPVLTPQVTTASVLPSEGAAVRMACYHHDKKELKNKLSHEACRLYAPGQKFDRLYQNKRGHPLGVHNCTANLGTSGCPLIINADGHPRFIGTQIEAHYKTGAGVARLFDGQYVKAYEAALDKMTSLSDQPIVQQPEQALVNLAANAEQPD